MTLREKLEMRTQPEPNSGCWLWRGATNSNGYGVVRISGVTRLAHRLSFAAATGIDPADRSVLHRCDIPLCVNPEHLFIGSQADNVRDKVSKGRQARGETSWQSRLSNAAVLEIREAYRTRTSFHWGAATFARRFGVSIQAISVAAMGKTWKSAELRAVARPRVVPAPPPAWERDR